MGFALGKVALLPHRNPLNGNDLQQSFGVVRKTGRCGNRQGVRQWSGAGKNEKYTVGVVIKRPILTIHSLKPGLLGVF